VQSTREHILTILKERGQATVEDLSGELGLTSVTVRHHLDILRGEGLVAPPIAHRRKTPGRPRYIYSLSEKASSFFPKRYGQLASLMLDEMRARLSQDELDQLFRRIGERIAEQATLPRGADFESRLAAAVEFLDELGYMADWERQDGDEYAIHIANCPYEQVALRDRETCEMDLALMTQLLGTPPRRISSSVDGDPQCIYVVRPPEE
jgi:predicted ArsR family transcriptional regulator